jgi:predicted DNA-binding transcriptional regulator AlpA
VAAPYWRVAKTQEKKVSEFDSIRVVDEPTALQLLGLSPRTWDRLRAAGDLPVKTQLSPRRVGYRVADLKAWLDARREPQTAA